MTIKGLVHKIKPLFRSLVPSRILLAYYALRGYNVAQLMYNETDAIIWVGDYTNWNEALKDSEGYNAPQILEKVLTSTLIVKEDTTKYERDSVVFDRLTYNWPLTTLLFNIALKNNNKLHVIDFGGALGSTYFQNRTILADAVNLSWSIVEQSHFVAAGIKHIENQIIRFFNSIEEAKKRGPAQVLLLSGVLQCLEDPMAIIADIQKHDFEYIILDRTAFIDATQWRICVQKIPPSIYNASYPVWFFDKKSFLKLFELKYSMVLEFDNGISPPYVIDNQSLATWSGFLFKKL